jgi:predicted nucleotidyltransferase
VDVADYLAELVDRVRRAAGMGLVGVYAGGSYALGAYAPGRSDLDVAVVVREAAPRALKDELVDTLRHEALPCPARGLELVVYREAVVREPTLDALFELNLNTGAAMPFRADLVADVADAHWFAIDRSILAQAGLALAGPPAADVFAPIPPVTLAPVLLEALRWHAGGEARGDDAVLNACRTLRFVEDGVWSSKPDAGAWALGRVDEPGLVRAALAVRSGEVSNGGPGDRPLDPQAVRAFVLGVADRVAAG